MKIFIQISAIAILLFLGANVSGADTLTLGQAIELALEKNFSIRIARSSDTIAENNVTAGNAGMLPALDANAGTNYSSTNVDMEFVDGRKITKDGNVSKSYNYGVQLSWTLFDGFAMFSSLDKYRAIREKSRIELQAEIEAMIRGLAAAYHDVLRLRHNLDVLNESIEISRERLERVSKAREYGAATGIEVLNARVDLNADSSSFLQTRLAMDNALRKAKFIIGIMDNKGLVFEGKTEFGDMPGLEQIRQLAEQNNTSINIALKNRQITELEREIILASFYPRISAGAGYDFSKSEADAGYMLSNQSKGWNVSLNASWNLFDGFRTNTAAENMELNSRINDIMIEELRAQIDMSVLGAYDNYIRNMEIMAMEEQNLETAKENFRRTQVLYRLGQATEIELRQSQVNMNRSRNSINNAAYNAKLAETELLLLSGMMLQK